MIAAMTVADLVRPSRKKLACLYDTILVVAGAGMIALCAQIAIGVPVPLTGQTFAVLIVGALLGSRRAVLCVLTYLMGGLMGLPVFAQGKGGLIAFAGPTGGYLLGFLAAAWVVGTLAEHGWDRQVATTALAMIVGSVALYACGLAWLCCLVYFAGQPLGGGILAIGLYPFLPGDALKIALATLLLPTGWKIIRHFKVDKCGEIG
jgi:biotin transport system substrate-specific component